MRGFQERSLVGRLVTVYLAIAFLASLLTAWSTWLAGRALLREAAFVRLETASRQKEANLRQWMRERQRDLDVLVRNLAGDSFPNVHSGGVPRGIGASAQALLANFQAVQPDVREILVLAPRGGRVVASTLPRSVGTYRATYDYYVKGRIGPAVRSVYPSPELLRPVVTVSAPVKGPGGRILAVVAMHLGLAPIDKIIRSRTGLGKTGEAFLVNGASLGVSGEGRAGGRRLASEGVRRALAGESGRGVYVNDFGVPVLGVYRWLPGQRMALVTEMAQAEAFAPAGRLALSSVFVGLAVGLALALAVYFMSRRLARPVLAVTAAAKRVAAGDLSATAPVLTQDELGDLAKTFNVMTGDLRDLYARLEREDRERGAILQGSFDGIAVAEHDGRIVYRNPGMERLFGCTPEAAPTLSALAGCIFPDGEERRAVMDAIRADFDRADAPVRVFGFTRTGGGRRWCRMKVSPMPGGRVVINAQDLTEIKRSEEIVRHMALHDQLTGLPNRHLFADRLDQAMRRARRLRLCVGVLFIDLDRFKRLNDTYGHARGDSVIAETARRLAACVRESDTVSRHGGDEFLVLLPDLVRMEDALPVAEKIRASLDAVATEEERFFSGASIGIAGYPEHGADREALLAAADAAMYAAKRAGGNAVRMAAPAAG